MVWRCRCAGRIAAAAAVVVDARWTVLGAELVPAWVMHELAIVAEAEAEASRVAWVVAEVMAVVAVAGVIAVVVHCLACGVTVGDVETVGKGLHLRLRDRVCIIDSYA